MNIHFFAMFMPSFNYTPGLTFCCTKLRRYRAFRYYKAGILLKAYRLLNYTRMNLGNIALLKWNFALYLSKITRPFIQPSSPSQKWQYKKCPIPPKAPYYNVAFIFRFSYNEKSPSRWVVSPTNQLVASPKVSAAN
jgi:hypothetical protein